MNSVGDVRMSGFSNRSRVADVVSWLDQAASPQSTEVVASHSACGRILAEEIHSSVDVPSFERAMMDGFAIRAEDVSGATDYQPATLRVVDEAWPGKPAAKTLESRQAIQVMTGAPLPHGADAVVPVELVNRNEENTIEVVAAVPRLKHIGQIGEDISRNSIILSPGRRIRPQDLGVLSSIGCARVTVYGSPKVRICLTGNELLPAGTVPTGHRITDANSPMLQALIRRDGGQPIFDGIINDDVDAIRAQMEAEWDVMLVSGGSSVGQEDFAPLLVRELGELPFHGIAMRPSSPAGIGRINDRLVFLLPGNPVSCLCAYDFFAGRAVRRLGGRRTDWPYRSREAVLSRDLSSQLGRLDYARVKIRGDQVEPIAISGASMLSSTTRADGFVLIAEDLEGYAAGTAVEVWLYD